MNYTLQLHSNNRTYPVPRGLHDLMADIAREVKLFYPFDYSIPFIPKLCLNEVGNHFCVLNVVV